MSKRKNLKHKNKYRSGFEKTIARLLDKNNIEFDYETLKLDYVLNCVYNPDFIVGNIIVEAKGNLTVQDRRKMLAVKTLHPTLDIRLWFMRDNPIRKGSKTKYSDWATKNNFPFYVGETFPKHWFNEKSS